MGSSDIVLVPEFICHSALEPFEQLNIVPLYYPVTDGLEPDWYELSKMMSRRVKALLVVHYFGQPQPIELCQAFCKAHSIRLIEDNAHGFGGTYRGRLLGTFGDVGIAAPRKSFPVPYGAYLYLEDTRQFDIAGLRTEPPRSLRIKHWVRHSLKSLPCVERALDLRRSIAERRRRLGPTPAYDSQTAFRDPPIDCDFGMDESTHTFLGQQDIEGVRVKRRRIYDLWHEWARSKGLVPVFPTLSAGAIPLVFPAFASSRANRLSLFERGHRLGVDIHSWPTLPGDIVSRKGAAMRLWERVVCFPIHQQMKLDVLLERLSVL
jgi:hypothetical protein